MIKKILFIMVLSLFFIQCDDSGKKKVVPPFSSQDQQQGTLLVDDTGKVIVSDGTVPEGESIPVVTEESSSSGSSSGGESTTLLNQGTDNSGDTSGTQSQSSSSGGDNTGTTGSSGSSGDSNTTASNPPADEGTKEEPPQVPDVEPVDNLTQDNSEFAKYDIHSSAGVYWIKDLVQDGKAVFGWEFPPSFTIKIESIDPEAKVFVTMYGVYPTKETDVFYQYMVSQNPSDCKDDGERHHKHKKDKKDHDDHGDSDHHGDKDGKVDDDHHGDGGGNEADDNKNKDGDKDKKHHGHKKDHKHNRCAMRDIQVDGSKWVIMGGKGYKYGYIEFHVLDANGNDITSTTKAKINVNINGTALTAFLTKIKVHPTPAFIAVTLLLLGIIVGINLLRRRLA